MKVLVFRHVPFEGLGRIADALEACGIGFDHADLYRPGAPLPDPTRYDGLIFMGGPMSANDPLPYLEHEMDFIRQAAAAGQPVLGVCLGAQLIAKALGARVYRNPVKEIGWFDLEFTAAAAQDSIFSGVSAREHVFHWHGETFDLPAGAVHLASSARCRNQAFRFGDSIYGLQFHLEVTPAMIGGWCKEDANCGDVSKLTEPIDVQKNAASLCDLALLVFTHWCELLGGSHSSVSKG